MSSIGCTDPENAGHIHGENLSAARGPAIRDNADGAGERHATGEKSDREKPMSSDVTYMWNLEKQNKGTRKGKKQVQATNRVAGGKGQGGCPWGKRSGRSRRPGME